MGERLATLPHRVAMAGGARWVSAGPLALALFAIAVLVLAGRFVVYLDYALAAVRYPFELDYGEGIVWQQALLIPGARMYGDITRFPFLVFHYPPVYHLVVRAVAAAGVDALIAGRSISLLSSLAIGALAAALAFQAVRERAGGLASFAGAAVAGLGFFCFLPVVVWSPLMRVDMLAIALSFLGVWCAARAATRPWLLYVAMVLFVLAAYTKQTCIVAPLATLPVMLAVNPRRTRAAACLGLLLGGAALAVLSWATEGGFLRHIVLYNLNRYNLIAASRALLSESPQLIFVALAIAAVPVGWKRLYADRAWASLESFRRDLACRDATRLMAILTLYLALTTCTLATLGKSGGSLNYLIEWMAVLSVLIGTLAARAVEQELARIRRGPAPPRPAFALLVPVALLVQVLILPATRDLPSADPARTRQRDELVERVRGANRPVLSDDMVLLLKAGKEVPWEPAIFAELASTGQWNERRIIEMIAAREFAFVVTLGDSSAAPYDGPYAPSVARAIEAAYPRTEEHAGRTVHLPPH